MIILANLFYIPLFPWILSIIFSQILFLIGIKFFALSHVEWEFIFKNLVLFLSSKKVLS